MNHLPVNDLLTVVVFAAVFAVPVYIEWLRKQSQPKPRGATKI